MIGNYTPILLTAILLISFNVMAQPNGPWVKTKNTPTGHWVMPLH